MKYNFKCGNCKKIFEKEIPIADYDKEKNNQTCPICNCKLLRVIEWQGIAEGSGDGWFGKTTGNVI